MTGSHTLTNEMMRDPKRNHNLTSLAIFDLFLDVVFMMANITPETVALMETTKLIWQN